MKKPDLNADIFLEKMDTPLQWEDLVVSDSLSNGLEDIQNYLKQGKSLKNNFQFGKKIKPGYRVLFSGPSGTGKTLSATLLGKQYNRDVYKVDLTQVISKYIGETEKNLSLIFDRSKGKDWILFFDEADAIFGKRTEVNNSNDRYSDQTTSFFLRAIDAYDGLLILSSSLKGHSNASFLRRFQLVLYFNVPDTNRRYRLWKKLKTDEFKYDNAIDLGNLAEQYELTPASIVNILNYSILKCLERKDRTIKLDDINTGIKKEIIKEGKGIV